MSALVCFGSAGVDIGVWTGREMLFNLPFLTETLMSMAFVEILLFFSIEARPPTPG